MKDDESIPESKVKRRNKSKRKEVCSVEEDDLTVTNGANSLKKLKTRNSLEHELDKEVDANETTVVCTLDGNIEENRDKKRRKRRNVDVSVTEERVIQEELEEKCNTTNFQQHEVDDQVDSNDINLIEAAGVLGTEDCGVQKRLKKKSKKRVSVDNEEGCMTVGTSCTTTLDLPEMENSNKRKKGKMCSKTN